MLRKCVDRCFISANFIAIISILTVLFCTFTLLLTQVDDQVNSNNNSRSDKNIYPNLTISLSWSVPAIPTSTIFSTNTFITVTTTATASSTTALKSSLLSSTILTTIPYRSTISTPSPTPQTRQSILIDNEEVLIPIAAATTFKTSKWLLDIPDIVVCKIVSTTSSSSDLSFVNFSSNPLAVKPYLQSQIKLETITNYVENKMESSDSTCNTFQLLSEGKLQGHLQVQCSKSCDTTLDNCIWRTLQWSMPNCNWISYVKDSFKLFECLVSPKKTTWIFVGDSTLRGIFSRILDLLGYSIPPLAFHGSFQLLTRQLTAFFEFWPHWNNEEENTAEYFEEFLLLFLQRIERVQGYNNTNNNDNNNNDNSSSSSSSSSNNNNTNNNNNNNSNEDLRKIPVFHASRKIVFVFFGITATVELVASVHKVLQYFFKANFANIIIVIKSKGVAYNPEWIRSTLAQLSPVYQETQKHNFFYFDSFTTSHPVWFLFPKDTCFCHGYRQVISGKPGSRIIGEVNDIWVEELLNGVCPMLN